jgi:hypothetical protein
MEQSLHSPYVIKNDFPGSLSRLRESGILRGPLSWYSGTDNMERSAVSASARSTDHRTRVEAVRERQISAAVAIKTAVAMKTTLSQRLQLSEHTMYRFANNRLGSQFKGWIDPRGSQFLG